MIYAIMANFMKKLWAHDIKMHIPGLDEICPLGGELHLPTAQNDLDKFKTALRKVLDEQSSNKVRRPE